MRRLWGQFFVGDGDIKYKFYRNIYSVFVLILFLFRGYFFIFILKLDEKKTRNFKNT